MTISIYNYKLPVETHNLYDVTICNDVIRTLVTHTPSMVDSWISDVKRTHCDKDHPLIVGLDVEWLPNPNKYTQNPPATLQLCVGGRCLIFQLLYSPNIPQSLVDFLRNVNYEFTGVEIEKDAEKLWRFNRLKVVNVADLCDLAVEKLGRKELGRGRAGLVSLAREVLGKEIEKDNRISWGPWDNEQLSDNQVKYACVDAFLSFQIGRSLRKNTTMTISIYNYKLPVETHNLYDVTICNEVIHTLVTHTPSMVDSWISGVKRTHRDKGHRLIVGLDVKWLPNLNRFTENPPATLQLCVGGRCLIFQLLYSRTIPQSLVEFLRNVDYEFMGVEIENDADKLSRFYDLKVVNVVDLCDLAVETLGREELGRAGLISLAREVLGKEIEKDKTNSWRSRWDNEQLSDDQVKYACVDAFLSFEIGRSLYEIGRSFSDDTGRSLISSLIGLGGSGSGSGSSSGSDDTGRSLISSLIGLGIGGGGSGSGSGSFHQSSSLTDETGRSLSLTGETVGRSSVLGKSLSLIGIGLGVGIGASLLMAKANHTDSDEDDDAHA